MAAPEYVPAKPMDDVRAYVSPPRRPSPWRAQRPGDLNSGQPHGHRFGNQGPDQGYALALARHFEGKLVLDDDERFDDAVAGCLGVALKRASLLGRAPVIHDWTVAFTIWGFLDDDPPAELKALRKQLFAEVSHPNHYPEQRRIADAVPESVLRQSHADVADAHRRSWSSLIDQAVLDNQGATHRPG
jgi:hypothetical protein